jgi:DNA-binding transcriptional MerR regulator
MKPISEHDSEARIGPAAERLGLSPRMVRYLDEQGVLRPERGPGPRGHRHFPPPELALAAAAVRATQGGHPSATLRALRDLADGRVRAARAAEDPLAWFELLALARAVEVVISDEVGPPPPPGDAGRGKRPPPGHGGSDRPL